MGTKTGPATAVRSACKLFTQGENSEGLRKCSLVVMSDTNHSCSDLWGSGWNKSWQSTLFVVDRPCSLERVTQESGT